MFHGNELPYDVIAQGLGWAVAVWLAAMAAVIARGMLSGGIALAGLRRCSFTGRHSRARTQALVASVAAAAVYAAIALLALRHGQVPTALPDPPNWLLYALGGSHLGYLGAKGTSAKRTLSQSNQGGDHD